MPMMSGTTGRTSSSHKPALGEVFPRAPHGEELPSLRQAGQEIQPMPEVKRISAPNAIRYQPNGLKSCVET